MMRAVQAMTPSEAAHWLSGFISSRPLNCPPHMRDQWIAAMIQGSRRNGIPLCKELLGLVACMISIESSFRADPPATDPSGHEGMADLLQRAEQDLFQRMGPILQAPPLSGLYEQYKKRYYSSLLACKTEGQVDALAGRIAEDLKRDAAILPEFIRRTIDPNIEKLAHVVRTKGSMQLNFNRAKQIMLDRGEKFTDEELRDYIYTIPGGVDVGIAALKPMFVQYAARYANPDDLSWLFFVGMDYHYGPFSSRNMMEQIRIKDLSGLQIELDGDLLRYDDEGCPRNEDSKTLQAAKAVLRDMPRDEIFKAFLLEKDPQYIYTEVHRRISQAHIDRFGETPFAVIGELWMGKEAQIKYGAQFKTRLYLKKLDRYLNSIPWD